MSVVVVTGAGGYIGGALTRRLQAAGKSVHRVSTRGDADLSRAAAWRPLIEDAETIIHLSWRTGLRAAEADPQGDEAINLAPLRALLAAAAEAGSRPQVLFASSVTIVGTGHSNPVNEATADRPLSVYDRHKKRAEEMLREATSHRAVRAASLRLANVYGFGSPSVNADRGVLNLAIARAAAGDPLPLYGDGAYIRDFVHVDDVVSAFVAALRAPGIFDGGHYVVATGQGHSLAQAYRWIADEARARSGRDVEVVRIAEPPDLMPIERRNFVGDASLFHRRTGWHATIDLRGGIRHWFDRHLDATVAGAG